MPLRLLTCPFSDPIQRLTTGFCLTLPISFLYGSIHEFLPLQSSSALTTLSIVLAVSGSSCICFSPVLHSACPSSLPIYLHQISLSPHTSFCFHSISLKEFHSIPPISVLRDVMLFWPVTPFLLSQLISSLLYCYAQFWILS